MSVFMGMAGTGDWVTNQEPENWRQAILKLYPNGSSPLTAILSMTESEETDSTTFHWWTWTLPRQGGAVTGLYTDSSLDTPVSGGEASGVTIYAKVAAATAQEFRAGHNCLLRVSTDPDADVFGEVLSRDASAGANSHIGVILREADDNSSNSNLTDCDTIVVASNASAQGAPAPEALMYEETEYSNYTSNSRNPVEASDDAVKTKSRVGDWWDNRKVEGLDMHGVELEKGLLYNVKWSGNDANGKLKKIGWGLMPFIRYYQSGNVFNYTLNSGYAGDYWSTGGDEWLDEVMMTVWQYNKSNGEKLAVCGNGALAGLNRLAKLTGVINLDSESTEFGLRLQRWKTPYGDLLLKTHPLLSHEPTTRYTMLILEPKLLKMRILTDSDTEYKEVEPRSDSTMTDARLGEWMTKWGLEIHHPECFAILNGVGKNNEM